MSSHGKRMKKTKQHKQKRKPIKQTLFSSSDDDQTNYAEQIEQFENNGEASEEAELDKLIVKPKELEYSTPTFNMNSSGDVKGKQSKTLPMNRILKNNLDIQEQPDNYTNINRQVKQYQENNGEVNTIQTSGEDNIASTMLTKETTTDEQQEIKTDKLDNNVDINGENNTLLLPYDSVASTRKQCLNNDIVVMYPDYNGPYKINKKVFRICYISVVVIMLITLLFIIVLQHFRNYIISKQPVEVAESEQDSKPTAFTGGWNNEKITKDYEQPIANSLDNIINKQNIVIEPVKRMRDSKGRFIKVK